MKKLLVWTAIIILSFLSLPSQSFADSPTPAQEVEGAATMGVAHYVEAKDTHVKDGSILSVSDQGGVPSTIPYDPQVIGVVSNDAAILLNSGGENSVPVISVGNVYMLVSSQKGIIKKGDLITTSTIPGVGVKALDSGYVLGTAMEDYTNADPKASDLIVVDLNLHYFNSKPTFAGSLSDVLKVAALSSKYDPAPIFKDIVAAIVVFGSFILGFLTFGRAASKGVEALGRNPAASRIIHLGIIFNVGIVCVIVLAGMSVAFLIIRL